MRPLTKAMAPRREKLAQSLPTSGRAGLIKMPTTRGPTGQSPSEFKALRTPLPEARARGLPGLPRALGPGIRAK